jgi:serine/threonine protein kinase
MDIKGQMIPYMAPELISPTQFDLHRKQVSREADIYAFGISMYEVVTGVRPFRMEGVRFDGMTLAVIEGRRPAKPNNAEAIGFGNGVWDLVEKCWSQDRAQRPSTWEVRLRLRVAAPLSSNDPPGPRIGVRNIDTYSPVSGHSMKRK